MSLTVSVEEAQDKLKELIFQLAPGDEIIIVEDQEPVAKLVGQQKPIPGTRLGPGLCKGVITYMAPDFDAPLDDFREYME
jgi:antitoxin (DNA-binding transcriptional repressor) of toxin-antitoxin stability system